MQLPMVNEGRYEPCDVLVLGGGMAGIAAAIAAARTGARTVLVEKAGWLGGMGIVGATGLHSYFNIYAAHPGVERARVVAGIAQEIVDRVQAMGGGLGHVQMERGGDFVSMLTPVEPETFKLAAAQMCIEAGVKLLLHTGWWCGTRQGVACSVPRSTLTAPAMATWPPGPAPISCTTRRVIPGPMRRALPFASATWIWPRWRLIWIARG
jgi:hypothetical protein